MFDLATGSTPVDLEFAPSTNRNLTGICAGYSSVTGRVYYHSDWSQRAVGNVAAGATVMAHEIGHYLGMGDAGTDPQTPSIMNNPLGGPDTTCQNAVVRTTTVQNTDGTASNNCINAVQNRWASSDAAANAIASARRMVFDSER